MRARCPRHQAAWWEAGREEPVLALSETHSLRLGGRQGWASGDAPTTQGLPLPGQRREQGQTTQSDGSPWQQEWKGTPSRSQALLWAVTTACSAGDRLQPSVAGRLQLLTSLWNGAMRRGGVHTQKGETQPREALLVSARHSVLVQASGSHLSKPRHLVQNDFFTGDCRILP